MNFRQEEDETVSDAWERFKYLIRKCPHHGIPHCIQLETFYNGLSNAAKIILDATAGGAFVSKTYNEAFDILEKVSNNNTEWSNPRAIVSKNASRVHDIDVITSLNAQIVALTNLADRNVPIILGRYFLATVRTLIDVQKGELTMRVKDQQVTFNIFKSLKFNGEAEDCSTLGTISDYFELSLIKCTHNEQTEGTDDDISEDDLIEVIDAFEQLDFTDRPT
ncbi:hypothetical protein L6452_01892 [Arctium lappa]|uniref:Uncharacterized protein n=1 Tax=Arctium lappa TaxID=4217 RepID=A0ACB9FI13_ARCLA|nr:hypothetical protein L6452_01892 [Arctium lappa]